MSAESDLQMICDHLKQNWPDGLKERCEAGFRPVPEPFKVLLASHVRLVMKTSKKKWNAFCVVGKTYESCHGDTHQTVIEQLFRFMFPSKKLLADYRDMFRMCVEDMLDRDDVYLELFFDPDA